MSAGLAASERLRRRCHGRARLIAPGYASHLAVSWALRWYGWLASLAPDDVVAQALLAVAADAPLAGRVNASVGARYQGWQADRTALQRRVDASVYALARAHGWRKVGGRAWRHEADPGTGTAPAVGGRWMAAWARA